MKLLKHCVLVIAVGSLFYCGNAQRASCEEDRRQTAELIALFGIICSVDRATGRVPNASCEGFYLPAAVAGSASCTPLAPEL